MTKGSGRVPDGTGLVVQAPSQSPLSRPSGDHPSRVWVLFCSTGEWSDRSEWPIGFVFDEATAERLTVRAGEEWRAANALYPPVEYPDGDVPWAEVTDEQAEAWDAEYEAARNKRSASIRAMLTVHPDAVSSCEYDDPSYHFHQVAVLASAGEAGTAETVEQGSVHEHATAKGGDAQ